MRDTLRSQRRHNHQERMRTHDQEPSTAETDTDTEGEDVEETNRIFQDAPVTRHSSGGLTPLELQSSTQTQC